MTLSILQLGGYIPVAMENKPEALQEILYISKLAPDSPIRVVADIAVKSRVANRARDITGLLIFDGMHFCQQFEGTEAEVARLMARIGHDSRHTDVAILHHGSLVERRFSRWSLGYTSVDDVDALTSLERLQGREAIEAFMGMVSSLDLDH